MGELVGFPSQDQGELCVPFIHCLVRLLVPEDGNDATLKKQTACQTRSKDLWFQGGTAIQGWAETFLSMSSDTRAPFLESLVVAGANQQHKVTLGDKGTQRHSYSCSTD